MQSVRIRIVLPLALAAIAYVAVGFFVDVPPYGIWLESSHARISITPGRARVDGRLRYTCTSWRPRRTDVYLPFYTGRGVGPAEALRIDTSAGTTFDAYDDGVVLHLAMTPKSEQTVAFSFEQPLSGHEYRFIFSVARGWSIPPNLVTYEVDGPAGTRIEPSPTRPLPGGGRLEGPAPEGVTVAWP